MNSGFEEKKAIRWLCFSLFFAIGLAADQLTKQWAIKNLTQDSLILIPGILNLTLRYNFGSAFGWKIINKEGLILITVFITIVFLWLFGKVTYLRGVSPFLAGAWGNLLDRWRFGYVIDFVDPSFWATFNLADVFIVAGIILIFLSLWFDEKRENSSL